MMFPFVSGFMVSLRHGSTLLDVDMTAGLAWVTLGDGSTVVLLDLATGTELARRTFGEDRPLERRGRNLLLQGRDSPLRVAPSNLTAGSRGVPIPDDGRLSTVVGDIAICTTEHLEERDGRSWYRWKRLGIDLNTGRILYVDAPAPGAVAWSDAARGLLFDVDGLRVVATAASSGEVVWSVTPFEGHLIDDINAVRSVGDDRVYACASTFDEDGRASLVAALDATTGDRVGVVRRAPPDRLGWWSEVGAGPEEALRGLAGYGWTFDGGHAVMQEGQLVVARNAPDGICVQRVALPALRDDRLAQGHVVGIADLDGNTELVVVPLPAPGPSDAFALRLEPRGEPASLEGERAVVSFVATSAPLVVAIHPVHGRISLSRGDEHAAIQKGDEVLLEGVEVRPGPVVSVARWSAAGAARPRTTVELAPGPVQLADPCESEAPALLGPLRARAAAAGVALVPAIERFVAAVESDAVFREAVEGLGMHFAEGKLAIDLLDALVDVDPEEGALDVSRFFPLWGNGHFDAVGGIVPGRDELVLLHLPELDWTPVGADLQAALRSRMREANPAPATAALVERKLAALASSPSLPRA